MRVCVFGDSITWGANDFERGGWVERLKAHYLKERDFDFYNLGISGDTSTDLLDRFEREAPAREPDCILFAIGVNDAQYEKTVNRPRTTIEQFETNVRKLIQKANKFSDKLALIGLTPVDETKTMPIPWSPDKFYDNARVKEYDAIVKSIAEKENVLFIPVFHTLDANTCDDGLHPDADGHEKMFEHIKNELEKYKLLEQ